MVSIGPYSESYNYRHMFDFQDISGPCPTLKVRKNSIMGIIQNNPDFSHFHEIVKLAKMEGKLNEPQFNSTLFIPSDKFLNTLYSPCYFEKMDNGTASQIIKFSTLYKIIDKSLLQSSPSSWFITQNKISRLYVSNINGRTALNQCVGVVHFNIQADNGLIHVVDDLLIPVETAPDYKFCSRSRIR